MKKLLNKTKNHVKDNSKKIHLHINKYHIKYIKWWFSLFLITKIVLLLLSWYFTVKVINKFEINILIVVILTLILIVILTFVEKQIIKEK